MLIETPIRHLLPYISSELEHLSESLTEVVKNITKDGQEKIQLKLDSDSTRFVPPCVNEHGVITIGESFLYYVWAICYYGSVYFDEGVVPAQEIALGKIKDHDFHLATAAKLLREWALSLYYGYNECPKDLPNPIIESNKYIKPACEYFIFTVCFLIEHELAHIHLKHFEGPNSIEKEADADKQATEWHLASKEGSSFNSTMGVMLGLCSMLSLDCSSNEDKCTHPSMYSRIQRYINSLTHENKDRFYQVLSLFVWDWDNQFCKDNDFDLNTTNAKDFVNGVFDQMGIEQFT